eukprot:TRINITY_DN3200_c0_g1_i3.p1 TRINITY_DN3200_c0_g1~~TRINITY_DN3200_c0_g1_i3.p1  ORF type:complete len:844 (-),score=78.05 TRINITY_DN3200_c0_g1_i3:138-2669(-)
MNQDGYSSLYVSTSQRCLSSIIVSGSFKQDSVLVVKKITGVDASGQYIWTQAGQSIFSANPTTITLHERTCASTWFILGNTDQTSTSPWTDVTFVGQTPVSKKRVTTCYKYNNYSSECAAASEGAYCMDTGVCGCLQNLDCFSNTDFPYCKPDKTCDRCTLLRNSTNPFGDHLFCRTRYPGFRFRPGSNIVLFTEQVAPDNYYREVCVRDGQSGACQRCNQAPSIPGLNHTVTDPRALLGAAGSVHCSTMLPNKPVCMDYWYHLFANAGSLYNPNLAGACAPCSANSQCYYALPNTPSCQNSTGSCVKCTNNDGCRGTGGNNCQSDGTCLTCKSNSDCGIKDVGREPVCNKKDGICKLCARNSECVGTTGANCQSTGQCASCKTDADCGSLDGGEIPQQKICDPGRGLCVSSCRTNLDCEHSTTGTNCMVDGTCLSCKTDADCGKLDGGEHPGDPRCNAKLGICDTPFKCLNNSMCNNTANCQADGSCLACVPDSCGVLDNDGQPNCNVTSRLCVSKCKTNSDCQDTQGSNCQKDGLCKSCTSNTDCGENDGGEKPDEITCNTVTGLCGPCMSNSDCPTTAANCGQTGVCFSCSAPGKNCETMDGPPNSTIQPHCDAYSGICITGCTADVHCTDDCLPHCDLDRHCCVECLQNSDCPHPNWRGSALQRTTCAKDTFTCKNGCSVDADCPPSVPACGTDGKCTQCVTDAHCQGDLTACDTATGQCVQCKMDKHCAHFGSKACSVTEHRCVACLYDSHCMPGLYCLTEQTTCHQCVYDSHCPSNQYCGDQYTCIRGSRGNLNIGALIGIGIAGFVVLLLVVVVIILWRRHKRDPLSSSAYDTRMM